MKKIIVALLILFTASLHAQQLQFGRFMFTLPEGFKQAKENTSLLLYNGNKQLCAVLFSAYPFGGNTEETFYKLWATELKFPDYIKGEINRLSAYEVNGYQCLYNSFEGETNGKPITKTACLYQSGNTCEAIISYSSDENTKLLLESLFKSLKMLPPASASPLTPLERSYQWYRALRGPDVSNSTMAVYQSQTAINFTGFTTPSQQHLQTLTDSLFYLRELPGLQMLFIGQTKMNDAAAAHIGTLRTIKHVQAIDQGFPIPLTNAGLQAISNAATIEVLDLRAVDASGITDAGMPHIARLTRLTKLSIGRSPGISINGIERLTPLKQLRELNLSYCTFSDADIPRLRLAIQQLPALQTLLLQSTGLTEQGAAQLRQDFPGITIYR